MKKIFTAILMILGHCSFAQCESGNSIGSVSLHLTTTGKQNGLGGEMGLNGVLNHFSAFLGMDVTPLQGLKGKDSTVSLVYVKGLYQFYNNTTEDLYFSGLLAPAFMNTDFEMLSGLRFLYVSGRNTALSIEPLWYMKEKKIHINFNLHFLL